MSETPEAVDSWRRVAERLVREKVAAEASNASLRQQLDGALAFIDKASGTALGIAMSGSHHPNPDEVLTDLSREGMDLSQSIRAALKSSEPKE